jgi:hypothetical protein
VVITAGRLSVSVSRPPSISRVTVQLAVHHLDLAGERRLRQAGQRGQHLAGLVAVVVDGLLAQDDQARLLLVDQGLQQLGHGQRLQFSAHSTRMPRSAPMAMAVRRVSWHWVTPQDTAMTSVTTPFSFRRTASSTAISSKGFMLIFTLAMSTPVPSDFTRTLTL